MARHRIEPPHHAAKVRRQPSIPTVLANLSKEVGSCRLASFTSPYLESELPIRRNPQRSRQIRKCFNPRYPNSPSRSGAAVVGPERSNRSRNFRSCPLVKTQIGFGDPEKYPTSPANPFHPRFPRWFLPTAENGSAIENRSKAWPFIPVWRLGLGHAAHPSPRQDAFGCAIMVIRQWASARPPPVQPRSDDTRRHVGAGFGRRPSISRRISANNRRGIATSASWNVT